jgi:trans-aconitate 2-methyltransferase
MNKKDWNPDLYLKYGKERIQPSIDLISRIDYNNPSTIIDIGCGPGNSTQILYQRWPDSKILGVDNSEAMIIKAKKDYPSQEWKLVDAEKEVISGKYDIVFSNATIQWIPNHPQLFHRLKNNITDKGIIAIQLPLFFDMYLGKAIAEISKVKRWAHLTESVNDLFTIHNSSEYYDILSEIFSSFEIWKTSYIHIMDSHYSILEMIRSTGLRPYLDRLKTNIDKKEFEVEVLEKIRNDYKEQRDGKVLFPFKRLFIIANK